MRMRKLKTTYAIDGGIAGAQRQIDDNGCFKFAGMWFQHDALKGKCEAWIETDCPYYTELSIYAIYYMPQPVTGDLICRITPAEGKTADTKSTL